MPLFSAAFDSSPYSHKLMSTTNTPGGRSLDVFAGNGLGGSTLINHMFYTRGSSAQYDAWQRNGAKGWDSEALLEYSIKSENAQWMANPTVHGTKGTPSRSFVQPQSHPRHRRMGQFSKRWIFLPGIPTVRHSYMI